MCLLQRQAGSLPRAPPGKPTLFPPLMSRLKFAPAGHSDGTKSRPQARREPQTGEAGPCCPDSSRAEAPRDHHLTPGGTSETTCPTPPLQERTLRPQDSPGPITPASSPALHSGGPQGRQARDMAQTPALPRWGINPHSADRWGWWPRHVCDRGGSQTQTPRRPGRNLSPAALSRAAPAAALPPPLQLCWAPGESTPDPTSSANPTPPGSIPALRSCLSTTHPDDVVRLFITRLSPQLS